MITTDDLRTIPAFEELSDADLAWLAEHAEERAFTADKKPFERGESAEYMAIVLDGAFQVILFDGNTPRVFGTRRKGDVTGLLPYSRLKTFSGDTHTLEPGRFALIHKSLFPEMLQRMPELGQRLVGMMSDRVRASAQGQQQREKLAALGKLAAGLAHELNNPAAAVRRDVATLRERLARLPDVVAALAGQGVTSEHTCLADALGQTSRERHAGLPPLSTLDRSEREDEWTDWLDDQGVEDGWKLADTLADARLTPGDFNEHIADVPSEALPALVTWVEGTLAAQRLLDDIEEAAGRISELVAAVKTYSHLDRAPDKQPTDLHKGLDSTLTMLGHKLRKKSIRVERRYAEDLPPVPLFVGEMNQVWSNLIDNAADALGEGGTLVIETQRAGDNAAVTLIDDGPGIPHDLQTRIFEPFFTTKDVGEGTGLGLDIVQRIVDQHNGTLHLESTPGRTAFQILLPLNEQV